MKIKRISAFLLLSSLVMLSGACTKENDNQINAVDLMSGILPNKTEGKAADTLFIENSADFFVQLFKNTINLKDKKNALISPVSVWLALSMTANGADNNTLSEMEKVLGGSIPISELNRYIYTYVNGLPSEEKSKLHIANSIWFKEGFQVNNNFLQVNADYFGAKAYQSAFDDMTLKDINLWVKLNTYGMIDEILDEIPREAILYLINAVAFDAEWKNIYNKTAVGKGEFNNMDGEKQTVDFMASEEGVYVEDNQATGFIKPYVNDTYSFVALLPKEGVSIESYIASLSGAGFMDTLKNAQQETVTVRLPKFSYHYGITMNDALEALGMPEAFDGEKADFSKMTALSMKNLYISKVLHKAFIEVNERGTKAGAATAVEIRPASMPPPPKKEVILERPFVYAIVDNTTKLPIFMGVVLTLE